MSSRDGRCVSLTESPTLGVRACRFLGNAQAPLVRRNRQRHPRHARECSHFCGRLAGVLFERERQLNG